MKNQELYDTLEQLHTELQKIRSVDDKDKELLKQLDEDIRSLLAAERSARRRPSRQFGETLRQGIERFEVSHPDLTLTMGQLAEILARMGI
jgi:hypothetical protein